MKKMVDLTMFNQQTWWFMVVYANLRFRFHQVSYMKYHVLHHVFAISLGMNLDELAIFGCFQTPLGISFPGIAPRCRIGAKTP